MKPIYLQIPDRQPALSPLVLATVTETIGSAPQKAGCSALFDKTGLLSGTVGGGVMEGKVLQIVQNTLRSNRSGLYHFELDHDISQYEEAVCGGRMTILVDATPENHLEIFEQMNHSLRHRIPGVLVTKVNKAPDNQISIHRFWVNEHSMDNLPHENFHQIAPEIRNMLEDDNPGNYKEVAAQGEEQDVRFFLEKVFPLPQLVIIGAGHIGKALSHLGNLLDFEITVIDDREEYANYENLPDADHIIVDEIGNALTRLDIAADTYVVIVSRGHVHDAEALKSCIGSEAAYLGMIGSKRKVSLMRKQFMDEGWATAEQWDAVHTPVGLKIYSKTVQEIAVSIAAQLILIRNQQNTGHA
jgi:xanthine dehydrogenase accessory factor